MDAQQLQQVAKEVGHVDLADHILAWDKKQAPRLVLTETDVTGRTTYREVKNPDARVCRHRPEHGALQMHGSGAQLVCGANGAKGIPCGYSEPVSR